MLLTALFGRGRNTITVASGEKSRVKVINVAGPLTTKEAVDALILAIQDILRCSSQERPLVIVANLANVTAISETGIQDLLIVREIVTCFGSEIKLACLTRTVLHALTKARVQDRIPIYESVEDGVASFA